MYLQIGYMGLSIGLHFHVSQGLTIAWETPTPPLPWQPGLLRADDGRGCNRQTCRHISFPEILERLTEAMGLPRESRRRRGSSTTIGMPAGTDCTKNNTPRTKRHTERPTAHFALQKRTPINVEPQKKHAGNETIQLETARRCAARQGAGDGRIATRPWYRRPRSPFEAASDGESRYRVGQASTPRRSGTGSSPSPPGRPLSTWSKHTE